MQKANNKPEYLKRYKFNWDTLDVIIGGRSALDVNSYLGRIDGEESIANFLEGYGFDSEDPIQKAELFGNFQEAIQFIKRYFLKEGNEEDGLDLKIPNVIFMITDISELFSIASQGLESKDPKIQEQAIWAGIILKVMHTILHTDKDLRYRYFSTIQLQVFDRFYKFLHREEDKLFLVNEADNEKIPLVEFETKSKKTRDSIIIKLLHKKENVAEELFDRIGIRFVTQDKLDTLRVIKFLHTNYVVMPHNIKPSRSINTLFDVEFFKKGYYELVSKAIDENMNEEEFALSLDEVLEGSSQSEKSENDNEHTSDKYQAVHFTCRQLIKYRNPFMDNFSDLRKMAKKSDPEDELAKKILSLDTSSVMRDIRFFYPYEVQITDLKSHQRNTDGEASHQDYKRSQIISAMNRIFKPLLQLKNIEIK